MPYLVTSTAQLILKYSSYSHYNYQTSPKPADLMTLYFTRSIAVISYSYPTHISRSEDVDLACAHNNAEACHTINRKGSKYAALHAQGSHVPVNALVLMYQNLSFWHDMDTQRYDTGGNAQPSDNLFSGIPNPDSRLFRTCVPRYIYHVFSNYSGGGYAVLTDNAPFAPMLVWKAICMLQFTR